METVTETLTLGAIETSLGRLLVGATENGVAHLSFKDTPGTRARAVKRAGLPVVDDPGRTAEALAGLADYFAGKSLTFEVPIDWRLTSDVQRKVLTTLYEQVPYGKVVTYGELDRLSGLNVGAQAIGQVMGSNPIPVIVPCHRVVAANGLGGYSGGSGVEVKRWLLTLEGSVPATLDWDPDQGPTAP
ncbi:methylated-DNA--[protein]-cysteine S-methyltransferase [Actinomadura rudentiformis]|uniref:methylated-DNA--[protein]-cysteine S-methyltransferase n=1 Tax=Actinomadura rudentiformis TaxID=359158 RepID=A0A6H9YTC0_9ACTN|nr:methylated-DNA--[protein]-cysteine S-methyltransferase [Actinomadura rudentiformis]KAB2345261.1 methylated-DNA--[protein]-cysteine S-methyltransferase [Actinomadura rudentiformis]